MLTYGLKDKDREQLEYPLTFIVGLVKTQMITYIYMFMI